MKPYQLWQNSFSGENKTKSEWKQVLKSWRPSKNGISVLHLATTIQWVNVNSNTEGISISWWPEQEEIKHIKYLLVDFTTPEISHNWAELKMSLIVYWTQHYEYGACQHPLCCLGSSYFGSYTKAKHVETQSVLCLLLPNPRLHWLKQAQEPWWEVENIHILH